LKEAVRSRETGGGRPNEIESASRVRPECASAD